MTCGWCGTFPLVDEIDECSECGSPLCFEYCPNGDNPIDDEGNNHCRNCFERMEQHMPKEEFDDKFNFV